MKKIPALSGARRLAAALLLAFPVAASSTICAAPAAAQMYPGVVKRYVVAVQQNEKIQLPLDSAVGISEAYPPTGEQRTAHGFVVTDSQGTFYTPSLGFIGRDHLVIHDPAATLVFELKVIPRLLPFAGRFDSKGPVETAGLYDNQTKSFLLCRPLESRHWPLDCKSYPVAGLADRPLIPVAWPDPHGGSDLPALFDVETSTLTVLGQRDGNLVAATLHSLPAGGWPLAGDWFGTGQRSLAAVQEDGIVETMESGNWNAWLGQLHVPEGDALVWPIVLQREDGPDAVALVDPANGDLGWLKLDGLGATLEGLEPCLGGENNFRQPLSWNMSPMPDSVAASTEIFFLDNPGLPAMELVPGLFRGGKPQTIPVKFPDDPPGN